LNQKSYQCTRCGHSDNYGLKNCARCGHSLGSTFGGNRRTTTGAQAPAEGETRSGGGWIQFFIFVFIIGISLYPYLKKKFPALEKFLSPGDNYERQANRAARKNKCLKAISLYQKALKAKGPFSQRRGKKKRARIHFRMALCYETLKRDAQAIEHAMRSARLNPRRSETYLLVGLIHERNKRYLPAIKSYEKGLLYRPRNVMLKIYLSKVLSRVPDKKLQNLPKALKLAQEASSRSRRRKPHALDTLAEVYFRMGKKEKALKTLYEALASAKRRRNNRMITYIRKRITFFNKATKLPSLRPKYRGILVRKRPAARPRSILGTMQPPARTRPQPRTVAPTSRPAPRIQKPTPRTRQPAPVKRPVEQRPFVMPTGKPHRRSHKLILPR